MLLRAAAALCPAVAPRLQRRLSHAGAAAPAQLLRLLCRVGDVAVFDKPVGMMVHPPPPGGTGAHRDMRYALHEAGALLGACPPEARFVSRLDAATSGALAAALSAAAARALKAAWCDAGRVTKRYLVLVSARAPLHDAWSDERPLRTRSYGGAARGPPRFRDAEDAEQVAEVADVDAPPLPPDTQRALTDFAVLARFPAADAALPYETALLAAQPHTGRWHQIRRHLSGAGLHVVGDVFHGKLRVNGPARERLGLRRMFLHAATLQIALDEDGAAAAGLPACRERERPWSLRCAAPLPPELRAALAQLPGWDDTVLDAFYAGYTA